MKDRLSLDSIINKALVNLQIEEDKSLIVDWEELYNELDESSKSNLVRVLIGQGAIKKENGKLVKDADKIASVKKKLGMK